MTAPERIAAYWTAADNDTMPSQMLTLTPKSPLFHGDMPKSQRIEYVRADLASPTPLAEALATIARLEGELGEARTAHSAEQRACLSAWGRTHAAEAKVAALVTAAKAVADDVCSYICPSIGLAGAEIPHDPACIALRAAISGCDHG